MEEEAGDSVGRTLHDIVCQLRGGTAAHARVVLAVGRPCAAHITAAAAITCMNTLQVHGGVIIRSRRLFQLLATWLRIVRPTPPSSSSGHPFAGEVRTQQRGVGADGRGVFGAHEAAKRI